MASYVGKVTVDGTSYPVGSTLYGTCATAAGTVAKVVTCANFDTLQTGVTIHVKFTYSNTVANPTLNVNSTGAKSIKRYGTTAPSTSAASSWNAGAVVSFTYDGDYWQMNDWINNNDNTYDRTRYNQNIKAKSAIVAANIIVANDDTGYFHLKTGAVFDITYPILYAAGAINANATGTNNYICIPFTVTTTQSLTLTAYKPVFIKGTLVGTKFTPVSTTPLTQTIPTTEDGYQYLLLGNAYSTTAMYLLPEHPIFEYGANGFVLHNNFLLCGSSVTAEYASNILDDTDRLPYILEVASNGHKYVYTPSAIQGGSDIHFSSLVANPTYTYASLRHMYKNSSGGLSIATMNLTDGAYKNNNVSNTEYWNTQSLRGSITPNITLPGISQHANANGRSGEIRYIFTAATANATFKAPSGVKLTDGETTTAAAGSIAYTNLTVGSIYECSFTILSSTLIALIMKEWPA